MSILAGMTDPRTDILTPELDADAETRLADLARRYREADGLILQVLSALGGQAEGLLGRLPAPVRDRLDGATRRALEIAFGAARSSRGRVGDLGDRLNTALATAMGAAGGLGGLPTALAELPVTTTVLFRAIQGIAAEHGFDPADEAVRLDCLQVFAAGGPLAGDDGSEVGFLAARVTLTGTTLRGIIARIAPRLAAVLGQKLAAQAVPIFGAMAGAATNYAFTSYYQEMAHVFFGLRRLALDKGLAYEDVLAEFRTRVSPPRMIG